MIKRFICLLVFLLLLTFNGCYCFMDYRQEALNVFHDIEIGMKGNADILGESIREGACLTADYDFLEAIGYGQIKDQSEVFIGEEIVHLFSNYPVPDSYIFGYPDKQYIAHNFPFASGNNVEENINISNGNERYNLEIGLIDTKFNSLFKLEYKCSDMNIRRIY